MLRAAFTLVGCAALIVVGASGAGASDWLPDPHTSASCNTSGAAPTSGYTSAVQGDCGVASDGSSRPAAHAKTSTGSAAKYMSCSYVYVPGTLPNPDASGPYFRSCEPSATPVDNSMSTDPTMKMPILVPVPAPPPTAEALARSEVRNLHMAPPALHLSPGLDQPQVVNADAWYWLDSASWAPVSASVSSSGLTVTVTATPATATWTSGDGGSVMCAGPGTPYPAGDANPPAQSPTCGHAFTRASTAFPGGTYPLTAQVSWQITWRASDKESGTLPPLTTSATAQLRVVEVQALVTGVRS